VSPKPCAGWGAVGQVRTAADLPNGSPKRGWDGGAEGVQPSRNPEHKSRRRPSDAETGHQQSPHQRSASGTLASLTASSSRIRYGSPRS